MFNLILPNLLTTNSEPRKKYTYVNNERTDSIEGYSYRLIDVVNGEVLNITIPKYIKLNPQSYVEIVNPIGTPYISGNRAVMSVKADNIIEAIE